MKTAHLLVCLSFSLATAFSFVTAQELDTPKPKQSPPAKPFVKLLPDSTSEQILPLPGKAARDVPKIGPARDWHLNDSSTGRAIISVENARIILDKPFELKVKFQPGYTTNHAYYNAFFNCLDHQPAVLAMFDSKEQYLGDLLAFTGGSFRGAGETSSGIIHPFRGLICGDCGRLV